MVLRNVSAFGHETPTIEIHETDDGFDAAFARWLTGRNPTDAAEWRRGVFLSLESRKPCR